jgi:hypothetical protein
MSKLRHSGRLKVTFRDGHLEYVRYELLYRSPYSAEVLKRWNNDDQPHRDR